MRRSLRSADEETAIPHDPKTGKPWPTYQVTLTLAPGSQKGSGPCTVPNGGMVNCGGAAKCSILVTCPSRQVALTWPSREPALPTQRANCGWTQACELQLKLK